MKPTSTISLLSAASCVLGSWLNSAVAQEAASPPGAAWSPPPATALKLGPVTVIGHYDNAVGTSDAASQGVVRGERLTDLPLLRPGEVLETVPGLVVTQHSGDGKANQYFLRGYNLDHGTDFATFVDNVPINMPTNAHGQGYTDLNFLIPELVDVIDYQKGPYFARNGDFSSAGSAQIRYVDQLDKSIADLTVGSHDYRRLLLGGSTPVGGARLGEAGVAEGGPRLLYALEGEMKNGPWAIPEKLRKLNGVLKLTDGSRANGWSVDAKAYSAHWDSTDHVPLEMIQSGVLCRYCAIDPTDGGHTQRLILSGEWHQHTDSGYTRASAYFHHYELQLWSDFTFDNDRSRTATPSGDATTVTPPNFPFLGNATHNSDQFSQLEHRNIIGGEVVRGWNQLLLGRESVTEAGAQLRVDHIDVSLLDTVARVPEYTVSADQVTQADLGLYIQNSTQWRPWLRSLVGLRVESIQMYQKDVTPNTPGLNDGNASATKVMPKLSLIFGPWDKTEYFVNAGAGLHSNDARGAIDRFDPTSADPHNASNYACGAAGNQLCAPQTVFGVAPLVSSRGFELGMRSDIIPGLQESLSLWWLHSDSELVYVADSDIGSTVPNGAARRVGLEWNNHYVCSRKLLLDLDLSWVRARYDDANANDSPGNFIPNAVPKVFTFGATYKPDERTSLGWTTRYIGAYPIVQDNSLPVAPSALTSNFIGQYKLTPDLTLRAEVLNVFNRQFYDIAYEQNYVVNSVGGAPLATPVANPNGITVHPSEPRQFRVGLNYKF
jgi:hypothetical protein